MITKEEKAIAWFLQTPKRTRVTVVNVQGEEGWMPLYPKAEPDCRTCLHGRQGEGIWQCDKCVLGDMYKPAPAVVLWRSE